MNSRPPSPYPYHTPPNPHYITSAVLHTILQRAAPRLNIPIRCIPSFETYSVLFTVSYIHSLSFLPLFLHGHPYHSVCVATNLSVALFDALPTIPSVMLFAPPMRKHPGPQRLFYPHDSLRICSSVFTPPATVSLSRMPHASVLPHKCLRSHTSDKFLQREQGLFFEFDLLFHQIRLCGRRSAFDAYPRCFASTPRVLST